MARMRVPAKTRKAIAKKGAAASREVSRRMPYALDVHAAAELVGVTTERLEILAKDRVLRHKWKRGALFISAESVSELLSEQCRQQKQCRKEVQSILGEPIGPELHTPRKYTSKTA